MKQSHDLGRRARRAEQIALHFVALFRDKGTELFFGFDPLSHGRDAKAAAKRSDGAHDRR